MQTKTKLPRRTASKKLTASLEDYLEAVLFLCDVHRVARVRDIAEHLGVGMPSVTAALKTLARRKLVHHEPYQYITLTDAGHELAEQVGQRHHAIRRFLRDVLGLDPASADANACRMEHAIDQDVLDRLRAFGEFITACPRTTSGWIDCFTTSCGEGLAGQRVCKTCLAETIKHIDAVPKASGESP